MCFSMMIMMSKLGMSALPLRFLTPFPNRFSRRCGTPPRLGYGIRQPARFPSEETRFASSFALLSFQSRNHARSVVHGLPHPHPSPPSIEKSGSPSGLLPKRRLDTDPPWMLKGDKGDEYLRTESGRRFGCAEPERSLFHSQIDQHMIGNAPDVIKTNPRGGSPRAAAFSCRGAKGSS